MPMISAEIFLHQELNFVKFAGSVRVCEDAIYVENNWQYKYRFILCGHEEELKNREINKHFCGESAIVTVERSPADLCDYMPFMDIEGHVNHIKTMINIFFNTGIYYKGEE